MRHTVLALLLLFSTSTAAWAQSPGHAVNSLGRWLGYGWSRGYHTQDNCAQGNCAGTLQHVHAEIPNYEQPEASYSEQPWQGAAEPQTHYPAWNTPAVNTPVAPQPPNRSQPSSKPDRLPRPKPAAPKQPMPADPRSPMPPAIPKIEIPPKVETPPANSAQRYQPRRAALGDGKYPLW